MNISAEHLFCKDEKLEENFYNDFLLVYETLADFREKILLFIIRCFTKENFNFEFLHKTSKEGEVILKKYDDLSNKSPIDDEEERHKLCIGFVSGAMIYIMSIKDIELDNNI